MLVGWASKGCDRAGIFSEPGGPKLSDRGAGSARSGVEWRGGRRVDRGSGIGIQFASPHPASSSVSAARGRVDVSDGGCCTVLLGVEGGGNMELDLE